MEPNEIVRRIDEWMSIENLYSDGSGFHSSQYFIMRDVKTLIESLQAQLIEGQNRHAQSALNYQQKCRDIAELESQLTESQRRERAAVEDIKKPSVCDCCKRYCQGDDMCIDNGRMNFDWRGPQETGEVHHGEK